MKIEIDFDLDSQEAEGKTLKECIREEVVEKVAGTIHQQIEEEIKKVVTKEIEKQVGSEIGKIFPALLDHEFTETSSWGEPKKTWTPRQRIYQELEKACVLDKNKTSYRSDQNTFTQLFYGAVEKWLSEQGAQIRKKLDDRFADEIIQIAESNLRERLKVKS